MALVNTYREPLLYDTAEMVEYKGLNREAYRADRMHRAMPVSTWRRPALGLDLTRAKYLSIDIESRDPGLRENGPGFVRGDANVIGVAVATEDFSGYFPMAHEHEADLNYDPAHVIDWLGYQLRHHHGPKLAANALYDLEGLWYAGAKTVSGVVYDPQIAEALIDEEAEDGYSLDVLAKKHLGRRKDEHLLREAAAIYGFSKKQVKSSLHKMSPRFVGPYAEEDARLNAEVLAKQRLILEAVDNEGDSLWPCFEKESALTPLLLKMRIRGVRVDLDRAVQVSKQMLQDIAAKERQLAEFAGFEMSVWAAADLARMCEEQHIPFNRTAAGAPSFTKDYFKDHGSPVIQKVGEIRSLKKTHDTFIKGYILDRHVNGRLHGQYHQTRTSEDSEAEDGDGSQYGARSGRLSSSKPNLTNLPSRDPIYGPLTRSLFVPEHGCRWGCFDFSGQEPRWLVHFAYLLKLQGAAEAVEKYRTDPTTNYHAWVASMTGLVKSAAKEVNLGLTYGMGKRKLAWKLGFITEKQIFDKTVVIPPAVDEILEKYHAGVPFVKGMMDITSRAAEHRGYIKTFWKRKSHFKTYEPAKYDAAAQRLALTLAQAQEQYPGERLRRSFTHKALNRLLQGSSADQMKQAMLDLDQEGIVPLLTVHDEIDESVESDAKAKRIEAIMINAVQASVPFLVDVQLEADWGQCK